MVKGTYYNAYIWVHTKDKKHFLIVKTIMHLGLISWLCFTVSKESALMEAGNSMLTSSIFPGLAGNFGFCACVLHAIVDMLRLHS